ncbi:aminoglycoside phosphotransferase family protein [Phenylobacterium sp.]|uniref:aminoglycoside phosphotransferase family protein n=1 Tax=Phenylobacterium sp. TaxID=1871053 RepID=UPI0027312E33|nr:aminoglycoside phosphotransferase family protein [Phenylobacterium sp.]MDP1617411.1 aminoglycoside phosphotransferase family protein [Phenylobacterium sp.]MDP1987256.1 aminoglycoside phosphotransferase family protein [Phenylobacterium sp.]
MTAICGSCTAPPWPGRSRSERVCGLGRLPEAVQRRALDEGERGRAWLAALPQILERLESLWRLESVHILDGGSEAVAIAVTLPGARPAVLKIAPPWADLLGAERRVLEAAGGVGFAELYAVDEAAHALLLERLGTRLDLLGWTPEAQMDALCEALMAVWRAPVPSGGLMDGAEKARRLGRFIAETAQALGAPLSPAVLARADEYAADRALAHDPARAVLAHGDAHPANALQAPDGGGFKFIDPDGLLIEPAYDLGVIMREWPEVLLEGGDPLAAGRARCARLAARTGVDAEAIWRWGYLETVSTGLLCCKLDVFDWREMFQVAEAWTAD